MRELFDKISFENAKSVTRTYSTSFSIGITLMAPKYQNAIHGIYGFVRLADEIVDTLYGYPQAQLLADFKKDTNSAISMGISLNPILNAFQKVVHDYDLEQRHIDAFFESMEMDLKPVNYTDSKYQEYIYGSAEVVGLMCLKVFSDGNPELYQSLQEPSRRLGAAFQKVNFLRDIQSDAQDRGRVYFPHLDLDNFCPKIKAEIESDIAEDFKVAKDGVYALPRGVRFGVLLAYLYYLALFNRIKETSANKILTERIRIDDWKKYLLFGRVFVQKQLASV